MGSLFSLCQCVISPWLGRCESLYLVNLSLYITRLRVFKVTTVLTPVSDRYGRKKVLLATMVGNILSAVIWVQSTSFVSASQLMDVPRESVLQVVRR